MRWTARRAVAAGWFLLVVGCTQSEGGSPSAPASAPAPTMENRATVAAARTPSLSQPVPGDLTTFAEALGRKLDRSHEPTSVPLPEGGILNVPNGHVAHASVLVRGPDGKLRSACVSSPAEVNALVKQVREGAGQ